MIRTIPGTFTNLGTGLPASFANRINMYDAVFSPLATPPAPPAGFLWPGWSTGATLIATVPAQSLAGGFFTVLSFGITANMIWGVAQNTPTYGKLSPVVCGITTSNQPPGPSNFFAGVLGLPADPSYRATLWDPDVDPLPPIFTPAPGTVFAAGIPLLPVAASIELPQPLTLRSGSTINIGIWMKPSLLAGIGPFSGLGSYLEILDAAYTVTYDDKGASNPTWSPGRS